MGHDVHCACRDWLYLALSVAAVAAAGFAPALFGWVRELHRADGLAGDLAESGERGEGRDG